MSEYFKTTFLPHRARCLVCAGDVLESLDGVRAFANHAQPSGAALQWARWLHAHGAHVTVIGPQIKKFLSADPGIEVLQSKSQGMRSLLDLIESLPDAYDFAFALCRSATLSPRCSFLHKIKAKDIAVPLEISVRPNASAFEALRRRWPTFGYDFEGQLSFHGPDSFDAGPCLERLRVLRGAASSVPVQYARAFNLPNFSGKHIIVTSGPTAETISTQGDVLTNFSSGRQGFSIAWIAALCGARVSLVSGPTYVTLPAHPNIEITLVRSAEQMLYAVHERMPADGFVAVAAVADFKAAVPISSPHTSGAALKLSPTVDILASVGYMQARPKAIIGFAAETTNIETYARGKLFAKGADVIFANIVGDARHCKDSSLNQVLEVTAQQTLWHPLEPKGQVGVRVASALAKLVG